MCTTVYMCLGFLVFWQAWMDLLHGSSNHCWTHRSPGKTWIIVVHLDRSSEWGKRYIFFFLGDAEYIWPISAPLHLLWLKSQSHTFSWVMWNFIGHQIWPSCWDCKEMFAVDSRGQQHSWKIAELGLSFDRVPSTYDEEQDVVSQAE